MSFSCFLKDKIVAIALMAFAIVTIEAFLLVYSYGIFIKIYIPVVLFGAYFIALILEYARKYRYYKNMNQLLNELEEKYLITEIIQTPNFTEGKLLKEILEQVNKSMLEHVNKYQYLQEDYKEYIEMWIHEIKIPIATSKMIIENNKSEVTKSLEEELDKVENYIEQALYYARSNTVDKDYYIRKSKLRDMVNECIKKNKTSFIEEKIFIDLHDLDLIVNTDSKWVNFILNQIVQNSIKYRKPNGVSKIEIYAKQGKENIVLWIRDNGMGIKKGEKARVFEKGFTGTNGRKLNKKSTGIGLYLCKKLCDKLGIGIELNSREEEGTEVALIFPNSSYIKMEESR